MYRIVLTGALSVAFAISSGAQSPPVVTEAEFLAVLDDSHPAVVTAAEELALARAELVGASTLDNPTIEALREDPEGAVHQLEVAVAWQLPDLARGPRIEAGEAVEAASLARLSQRRRDLVATLRTVYAEWALAVARRDQLDVQAVRMEALATREAARRDRGESSGLAAHRLTLAALALRSRVVLAEAAAAEAFARAERWSPDLPTGARPELPPLPPATPSSGPPPILEAAAADVAAATLEREAVGRFVLSPEVALGWQRQELGSVSTDGPLFGIAWSVPLFDRNQAERGAADARVASAEAELELLRREVASERAAATATYERLTASVTAAEAALADNGRMLDGAEASFRLGETTLTDLLDIHRSVAEGRLAFLDLYDAALAAHRGLERLSAAPATHLDTASHRETEP